MPENGEEVTSPAVLPPCAACRAQRRRCEPRCVFAPHFPAEAYDARDRFMAVHSTFGASNVGKMLADVKDPEERQRAADTLVAEAKAREKDPALGCVSYLTILQEVNKEARAWVDAVRAQIAKEFGPEAAALPVDVAAAEPSLRMEATAQVAAALKGAREMDAMLLGVRKRNDARWWQMHGVDPPAAPWSEQPMSMPQAAGRDYRLAAQMAGTQKSIAEGEQRLLMPRSHHAAAPVAAEQQDVMTMVQMQQGDCGTEQGVRDGFVYGYEHVQMHAAETARAEAMASRQTSFLDAYQHQQMAPTGQWDAAAEQNVMAMMQMQQSAAAAWQHQDPSTQHAMMHQGPQEMPQHYASTSLDVTVWLQQQQTAAAEETSEQDMMMQMQMQQAAAAVEARKEELMLQLRELINKAMSEQVAGTGEVAREQDMDMGRWEQVAGTGELAEQEMIQMAAAAQQQHAMAQYAQTDLDINLGHGYPNGPPHQDILQQLVQAQQLAATAELAGEQEMITQQAAAAELAREQEMMMFQHDAAAELARVQEMTMIQQAAAAQQQHQHSMAQYSEAELDMLLGQDHPYMPQPTVQQMLHEQQLADAVGVTRVPNTTVMQQIADYENAEHASGFGATKAFLSPGSAEAAPPQAQTAMALGLQMDSPAPLPPLPPSLGQQYAQVSHQQRADGGDQRFDFAKYLFD